MKVLKKGKEVKGASVFYDGNGTPQYVQIEGVNYDPTAFEIVEGETKTVKKDGDKSKTKPKSKSKTTKTKSKAAPKSKKPESKEK